MTLALNLKAMVQQGDVLIMRENVARQDTTYFAERQKALKERMKDHPGKARDWDPDSKHVQYAVIPGHNIDPSTSRQVRRQLERLAAKSWKVDRRKGITRTTVTRVITSRYKPHQGQGVRYTVGLPLVTFIRHTV